MPKVIFVGNKTPSGKPPVGLKAICGNCGAELETTDDEPSARAGTQEDFPSTWYGWYITCPIKNCGHRVFFKWK